MSGIKWIPLCGEEAELLILMMITFSIFDIWRSFLKTFLKSQRSYLQILENKATSVTVWHLSICVANTEFGWLQPSCIWRSNNCNTYLNVIFWLHQNWLWLSISLHTDNSIIFFFELSEFSNSIEKANTISTTYRYQLQHQIGTAHRFPSVVR